MGRWMAGLALLAACSFDTSGSGGGRDGSPEGGIDAGGSRDGAADPDAGGDCVGSALDFTPDNWIEVADQSLDLTDDFTVSAWVRPREIDDEYHVASRHDSGASEGYVLMIKDRMPAFRVYFEDDQGPASDCHCAAEGEEVVADHWSHIAGSFSGGMIHLFRNGELIASCDCDELCNGCETAAVAPHGGPMAIGIETSRLDRFGVEGLIDEVQVLGSALSASFDPLAGSACSPDTLLMFRFDSPVGQEVTSECGAPPSGRLGSEAGADPNDPVEVETDCPEL